MLQTERLVILFQQKFRNRYKRYPYSLKTVRESKWYPHFEKFALTTRLEDGDIDAFLDRLFSDDSVIWPFVLSQDRARQLEKNILDEKAHYKQGLSEKDYIKETLKGCKAWCKSKGITENQLGEFMKDPAVQSLADRGRYYMPMFLFSRVFLSKHELTEDDILKKNSLRAFNSSVYEALKVALKDDFID